MMQGGRDSFTETQRVMGWGGDGEGRASEKVKEARNLLEGDEPPQNGRLGKAGEEMHI